MKLLKNGVDLLPALQEFIGISEQLFIFIPYIKLPALKELLKDTKHCKAVFVRWTTKDIISGASDLEIYQYCQERNIALFRNPRLHLKAFLNNYRDAFIGSSNISARALNYPATNHYNYELATIISNLNISDRLYFSIIEQESILITDHIYDQFVMQLPTKKNEFPEESDFQIKLEFPDKDFLISSLPLTYNLETLYRVYESKNFINDVELNCVSHDLALYKLNFELSSEEFKTLLQHNFLSHPFIKAFLEKVNEAGQMYFGTAKQWIHENCSDVPLPKRWEITENIQILYRWIVKLSNGRYEVDRPNHSERLYVVDKFK